MPTPYAFATDGAAVKLPLWNLPKGGDVTRGINTMTDKWWKNRGLAMGFTPHGLELSVAGEPVRCLVPWHMIANVWTHDDAAAVSEAQKPLNPNDDGTPVYRGPEPVVVEKRRAVRP